VAGNGWCSYSVRCTCVGFPALALPCGMCRNSDCACHNHCEHIEFPDDAGVGCWQIVWGVWARGNHMCVACVCSVTGAMKDIVATFMSTFNVFALRCMF